MDDIVIVARTKMNGCTIRLSLSLTFRGVGKGRIIKERRAIFDHFDGILPLKGNDSDRFPLNHSVLLPQFLLQRCTNQSRGSGNTNRIIVTGG